MRRSLPVLLLLCPLLLVSPHPAFPGGPAAAQVVTEAPAPAMTAGQEPERLPAREAPPRTLRAYWHVFIAFAVTWLLLFGYVLWLGRRVSRLDRALGTEPPVRE